MLEQHGEKLYNLYKQVCRQELRLPALRQGGVAAWAEGWAAQLRSLAGPQSAYVHLTAHGH